MGIGSLLQCGSPPGSIFPSGFKGPGLKLDWGPPGTIIQQHLGLVNTSEFDEIRCTYDYSSSPNHTTHTYCLPGTIKGSTAGRYQCAVCGVHEVQLLIRLNQGFPKETRLFTLKMFPWSAVFSIEPKVPGQRSTEELVTNTLMLELGAMVKRTERIRLERAKEGRRRRRSSSSSTADYSWLASTQTPQPYELTPNDVLELQDLCAKIPPAQCGPLIVRFRRLVSQMEPEVHEVPRMFRSVLRDCVNEICDNEDLQECVIEKQQRSKSLSFVTFRTKFRTGPFSKGSGLRGSRGNLQQQVDWFDEEDSEEDDEVIRARAKRGRSRSMPEITPMEQSAHA